MRNHTLRVKVHQLGYVVGDLDAAIGYWTGLGVGPFFHTLQAELAGFRFEGRPQGGAVETAVSFAGNAQLELIKPLEGPRNRFHQFLSEGRDGLQHVGMFTDEIDADQAAALADGMVIAQEGVSSVDAGTRYVCLERPGPQAGVMLELIGMGPRKWKIFEAMRTEAQAWDGSRPVRPMQEIFDRF